MLLTPVAGVITTSVMQAFARPNMHGMGVLTNKQLIQQKLASDPNNASVWDVLEARLENGQLASSDIDAAVSELTKLLRKKPEGWDQPLSWQREFLSEARKKDLISQEVLIDVCDAYFGKRPYIRPINAIGGNVRSINIEYGTNWDSDSHHGLQTAHLWHVNEILIDGTPMELRRSSRHSQRYDGYAEQPIPKDAKQLTAKIEAAYVDSRKLVGLEPDRLPPERWPKALKRWTMDVEIPLDGTDPFKIKRPQRQLRPVTDPSKKPTNPQVQRLVVQQDEGGFKTLVLELADPIKPTVPLSFDVLLEYEDSKASLGSYYVIPYDNGVSYSGSQLVTRGHVVDETTDYATVIFEPNAEHLKKALENSHDRKLEAIDEVWDKKIVLPDLELERLDLDIEKGVN